MWSTIRRWLIRMVESRGTAAFMTAALLVGVLVGLGAAALVGAIEFFLWIAEWLRESISIGRPIVFLLLLIGLGTSWGINRIWGPGIAGGGVTETMVGLSLRGGYLPTRTIIAKIMATGATLGLGGSLGREGPAVQIGATIGSSFARYTRFGEDQIRGLVAAGAAAGIGASFNAPIAGMLFAMEVILGNFAIRHLNAVVVASVAAAVTAKEIIGAETFLSAPPHQLGHPAELLLYAMLGIFAALIGVLFLRMLDATHTLSVRLPGWIRPVAGSAAVGVLVLIEPELFGTGQEYLAGLLRLGTAPEALWITFLAVAILKTASAAFSKAGGGAGGSMMPSLVMGGSLGAALAILLQPIWGFSDLNAGAFAVVGMAATFAATGRAPLTAILLVFEITGDYNLVLPLMLAASLATFLGERLHRASVYTLPLKHEGIRLAQREDIDLLDTVDVGDVMSISQDLLTPDMTAAAARDELVEKRHHGLPVVDDGRLVGLATLSDLEGAAPDAALPDVMTKNPITASPRMPVSAALARMASLDVGRLPVVSDSSPDHYLGMFRRESVVHAYHEALGATTDRQLYRERIKQRTDPGAGFFEIPVLPESAIDGHLIHQVTWPEGLTLVSVRRGASVLIPHGDTVIRSGDTITAFGSGDARIDLAQIVEPANPDNTS